MPTHEENAATAIEMQEHMAAQQTSGLSIRQYCKDKGLDVHRFNYWYYKAKREDAARSDVRGFSLVLPPVEAVPFNTAPVEVTLANGTRIAFHGVNSFDLFKTLL